MTQQLIKKHKNPKRRYEDQLCRDLGITKKQYRKLYKKAKRHVKSEK